MPVTLVAASLCGIGTIGAQNCNNGVAAKFYPTAIRATGVGWALAVGRIGSIFGALIGGALLATGMDNRTLFLVAAVPPLCAAIGYIAMGRQPELRGDAALRPVQDLPVLIWRIAGLQTDCYSQA